MRKLSSLASLFCLCMVLITKVHAQAPYPNKTIRIIAGCGIVSGSDPEKELHESNAKFAPMRSALE